MILAKTVCEPLFNFTQLVFANKTEEMKKTAFSHSAAVLLFKRLDQAAGLPVKEALSLPISEGRPLYELLTQYIFFFTMNPDLPFPPGFLLGTNDLQLGKPLLGYFVERKFPFPQTLPK